MTATEKLALAQRHLEKVHTAAWRPIDWADLSIYGLYALEAAVDAACLHLGIVTKTTHPNRVVNAQALSREHQLDDVSGLLRDLNEARKNEVYGDVVAPDLNAEDVAAEIDAYVDSVALLIER